MYRIKQFLLVLGDLTALYGGLYGALLLRYWGNLPTRAIGLFRPFSYLFLAAIVVLFIAGAYDLGRAKNAWQFFQKIIISAGVWMVLGIMYFYLNRENFITPKTILLLTTLSGFGLISLWRFIHNRFLSSVFLKTNVLFMGITPQTLEVLTLVSNEPQHGYAPLGVFDPRASTLPSGVTTTFIRDLAALEEYLKNTQLIVIAPELAKDPTLLPVLYRNLFRQIEVVDLAEFYETVMGRIPPFTFSETWFLIHLREQQKRMHDRLRIITDYTIALALAIVFLAMFPLFAFLIKLTSHGSVLFAQDRIGRGGKRFIIYKFRTMHSLAPDGSAETHGPEFAQVNDERITLLGKILRRTRLDELPQFVNILRGEMSIIGPRPERPEFVEALIKKMPFYSLRHLIKPGLTGWAQLHESYYGTLDENLRKLEYDLYYVKNRGPVLDTVILLKTIAVLARLAGR